MSDVLSAQKKIEISTPYDPVHLTHVGFNSDTGEFTGLPKEWQQLLQESGISRQDQEANPQAVMDIVAFYQDAATSQGNTDVWKKMGAAKGNHAPGTPRTDTSSEDGVKGSTQPILYEKPRAAPAPPVECTPSDQGTLAAPSFDRRLGSASSSAETLLKASRPAPAPGAPKSGSPSLGTKPSSGQRPPEWHTVGVAANGASSATATSSSSSSSAANKNVKGPGAVPRRRETKKEHHQGLGSYRQVASHLHTDADPTKLYRSLQKIGQGASGGVFTAYQVGPTCRWRSSR